MQKFDVPLEQATTSSLEALQALSLGSKVTNTKGYGAALPYDQRTIQLDPEFAMGYEHVGGDYMALGQLGRASEYYSKAFELGEHASKREKLAIEAVYYQFVTGELDKAASTSQEMIDSYPRDNYGYFYLSSTSCSLGEYERAEWPARQARQLAPDRVGEHEQLVNVLIASQRFDEARQTIQGALARKLDDYILRSALYGLAFLAADSSVMAEQQRWFVGKAEENSGLSLAADTEGYAGHVAKSRELTKRSVESATKSDSREDAAIWWENAALREAAFGNFKEVQSAAAAGLKLVPDSQSVMVEAALAYAMAGHATQAQSLAQDLNKRRPLDTQMQLLWLPAIRAQLALDRKSPSEAVNHLKAALPPIEYGQIFFITQLSCLYTTYIRGQAYLAADRARKLLQSSRRFSTTAAWSGTAGREHWLTFESVVPTRLQVTLPKRKRPTRTSSLCGKMPT